MTHVIFLDPAKDEMLKAAEYYDNFVVGLGDSFISEVKHTVQRIARNPKTGRKIRGHVRRMLVRRFPFGILYCIEEEDIVIIAVMHFRRHPDYWPDRI